MKQIIATKDAPEAIGPYSQAVRFGNLLFTAGQIPLRPDGGFEDGDMTAQATQSMKNLKAVLEAAGSGLQHVVKTTCFIKNMDDFAAFNEVYGKYMDGNLAARSTVEVARLPKDALVEVEAIAIVP